MAHRMPSPAVLLLMTVSAALFLGLAAWGWACLVVVLLTVAALFSGINLCGCKRPDTRGRWIIAPFSLIFLAVAWLPAYADRRDLGTLDGDAVRSVRSWRSRSSRAMSARTTFTCSSPARRTCRRAT